MIMAIEAESYQATREALMADPIIQAMADVVPPLAVAGLSDDDGEPTWGFIRKAMDTYARLGGTVETHIGGPAEAVLMIVRERDA
jgi:hypothetical protein